MRWRATTARDGDRRSSSPSSDTPDVSPAMVWMSALPRLATAIACGASHPALRADDSFSGQAISGRVGIRDPRSRRHRSCDPDRSIESQLRVQPLRTPRADRACQRPMPRRARRSPSPPVWRKPERNDKRAIPPHGPCCDDLVAGPRDVVRASVGRGHIPSAGPAEPSGDVHTAIAEPLPTPTATQPASVSVAAIICAPTCPSLAGARSQVTWSRLSQLVPAMSSAPSSEFRYVDPTAVAGHAVAADGQPEDLGPDRALRDPSAAATCVHPRWPRTAARLEVRTEHR